MCDACHSVLVSDLHWRPNRHAFLLRLSGLMAPNSSGLYLREHGRKLVEFHLPFVMEVFNTVRPLIALRLAPSIPRFLVSGPSLWERTQLRSAVWTEVISACQTLWRCDCQIPSRCRSMPDPIVRAMPDSVASIMPDLVAS